MLLLHHYRAPWECTKDDLSRAQKLNSTLQKVWLLQSGQKKPFNFSEEQKVFCLRNGLTARPEKISLDQYIRFKAIDLRQDFIRSFDQAGIEQGDLKTIFPQQGSGIQSTQRWIWAFCFPLFAVETVEIGMCE